MDNGGGPQGPGLDRRGVGARLRRVAAQGGARRRATTSARDGALGAKPAQGGLGSLHRRSEGAARSRRCRATARRTRGRRSRPTTGRRSRPARASASRPRRSAKDVVIAGPVEPRRLPQVLRPGHRPPGDAHRGAPRRQRDLRPERLAARLAPQARAEARRPRSTRSPRTSSRTPRRCRGGRYSLVRVPIFPVAHAFRAGSRIRVTIRPPAGIARAGTSTPSTRAGRGTRSPSVARAPPSWCCRCSPARPPRAPRSRAPPRCAASRAAPTRPPPTAADPPSRCSGADELRAELVALVGQPRLVVDAEAAARQRQHVEVAHVGDGVVRLLEAAVPSVSRASPVRSNQFSSAVARPS